MTRAAYESKYRDVGGVRAHYLEAGTEHDTTVLLIHGGGLHSSAELNYGYCIEPLARHFHVLALDLVGFGFTDGHGPEHYTNTARSEFAIAFLRALGKRAHIIGNSNGGWVSQYIGHEAPDLIDRMVIINSRSGTFPVDPDADPKDRFSKGFFPTVDLTHYPESDNIREYLLEFYFDKSIVTPERVDRYVEIARRNWDFANAREAVVGSSPQAVNEHKRYKGKHISEYVHELDTPILLTWSQENQSGSTPAETLKFLQRIRDGEMHVFQYAGHHVQIERPERWASVVTDFLHSVR